MRLDGNRLATPTAMWFNSTGDNNVASGLSALFSNTTGSNNVDANPGKAGEAGTIGIGTDGHLHLGE